MHPAANGIQTSTVRIATRISAAAIPYRFISSSCRLSIRSSTSYPGWISLCSSGFVRFVLVPPIPCTFRTRYGKSRCDPGSPYMASYSSLSCAASLVSAWFLCSTASRECSEIERQHLADPGQFRRWQSAVVQMTQKRFVSDSCQPGQVLQAHSRTPGRSGYDVFCTARLFALFLF